MRLEGREEKWNIRAVVDRVETKVDELAGVFKYHTVLRRDGQPSVPAEP